jgi:hypothetical protein
VSVYLLRSEEDVLVVTHVLREEEVFGGVALAKSSRRLFWWCHSC